MLEERVDWRKPSLAGLSFPEEEGRAELAIQSALRRGWLFGSQAFREKMLGLLARKTTSGTRRREDGYHGAEIRDHGLEKAQRIISAGCRKLGISLTQLRGAPKGDWRKAVLAELVHSHTVMRLDWIRETLAMGDRSHCCRLIRQARLPKADALQTRLLSDVLKVINKP